jgi:hydrogenase maturation protein HypF
MTLDAPVRGRRRTRVRVHGTVQGVGFRPYVYRLAAELGLAGYVLNDAHGVLLEVEGNPPAVAEFLARLGPEAPPLATLERLLTEERPAAGDDAFTIAQSTAQGTADAPVTPDSATCVDCLNELLDPADRRFRYPFINCTNCGPRFTIVRGIPYDRPQTTMAGFAMCPSCQAEYDDPANRRFHAQPNACPQCGPSVSLLGGDGRPAADPGRDSLATVAAALRQGAIVAVKGIGGYHLACRADDELAVSRLRARKHREDKPFAVMAVSLDAARQLVWLDEREGELLTGAQRPIVLAPRRAGAPVADAVAPGAPELGVMLPYSPLHHLLLADAGTTLVMTSGNTSDEPIAYRDGDAIERLPGIADLFLIHDRPIETRTDDTVVRVASVAGRRRLTFLRRSRGYVPGALALPHDGTPRPLLACGAELKSTFCVGKGERAWLSHHIGDLHNYETLRSFVDGIEHFGRLFAVAPEVVVHDLHPEYLSTKYAHERDGVELIGVQHHHAHLAACLAEHGEDGPAVGVIYDGTGYGPDGTVWGGELLLGDLASSRRLGTLVSVPLPGGERAVRQPWRMACSWLRAAHEAPPELPRSLSGRVDPRAWRQVRGLIESGTASPQTTSMGRLFDAVAALAGIRAEVNFEGQAAIELEAACDPHERGSYPISVTPGSGGGLDAGSGAGAGLELIDPRPTLRSVAADARAGVSPGVIASRFHAAVARATVQACTRLAAAHGTELAVLSGGVFQNRRLLESVSSGLVAEGLRVLVPERLPANDGGIAYGQAVVAAARLAAAPGEVAGP